MKYSELMQMISEYGDIRVKEALQYDSDYHEGAEYMGKLGTIILENFRDSLE